MKFKSLTAKLAALLCACGFAFSAWADNVAQIGDNKYETLADAIAAAQAGDTVQLLADVELSSTLEITKSITLDLGGHTLTKTLASTGDTTPMIKALSGTVAINNGSITYDLSTYTGTVSTSNANLLKVGMNMSNGIYSYGDCNLTLNGINANVTFPGGKANMTMVYVESGRLNIVDSNFVATTDVSNKKTQYIIYTTTHSQAQVNAYVSISGTSVIGTTNSQPGIHAVWLQGANDTLVISGNDVSVYADATWKPNSYSTSYGYAVNNQSGATCTIEGGRFKGKVWQTKGAVTVSGGYFNYAQGTSGQKNKVTVPEGYVFTDNTDTITAQEYPYVVKPDVPSVAQIGSTTYGSLADAIAAVPTDGTETTITMVADSAEAATITIANTQNVVLDLAGHTVSYTTDASSKSVYFITNKGELTIKDSGTNGDIVFTAAPYNTSYSYETVTIYNLDGTLTLKSGTIKNATLGGLAYAVNNSSNAWGKGDDKETVFVMEGGVLSAPQGDAALRVYQNCAQSSDPYSHNTVTISGGTILDTGIFLDNNIYQATAQTTGDGILIDIEISGGTINGLIDLKLRHAFNTSFTVTGGDFTNAKLRVRKQTDSVHVWNVQNEPTVPVAVISGGAWLFDSSANSAFNTSSAWTTTSSWTSYKPYKVTGGVFNVDLNNYAGIVFEEGKTGVANTDELTMAAYPYTVGVAVVPVAQIGETTYGSLADAIAAAQAGDTILLLADATLDAAVTVSKSLTITLDGHSITGTITAGTGYELVTSDTAYVVRGAGYAGEVLPAGPDMSGAVINVTAANAQYTLDGAYGDINGKTINFTESIAAVLELCRATKYEGSGTSYKIGYNTDNLPLPWSEENIATIKAHNGMMTYYRTVSNIVFTANQGVTLQGFAFTNGYHQTGK